ncbi:MAG TPA: type II toxin-antitoxin system HipA family toxin [Steroidobacteraceae bacterium]|nr:type II toxin-antitoxin system HipA family toxin [Steroidobacteraceae bacterium]
MPISSDRAYVYLQLPGSLEIATAGFFEQQERSGVPLGIFVYSPAYLERSDAVALDPFELPLRAGRFETVKLSGIFGPLRDASPDAWGRRIIERQLHRTDLSEVEYLLHSPEDRVGALSFGRGKSPPPPESRFNQVLALARLIEVAQAIELNDTVELPPQVVELVQPGTSLGGARPKNVVETDDGLWIAKFPAREDRWNNARVEASMLGLARECNVSACDHRVVGIGGADVLLVRRFDRVRVEAGYVRHRFVSGLTVLDAGEVIGDRSHWSYLLLADELRRRTHRPAQDLRQLFARMTFNALISNTDDHPRNHGLIAPGRDFELAPAYDLTPNPLISFERRDLAMIVGRFGRYANRENLLSECARFRLAREEAAALVDGMQAIVRARWRPLMRAHGVSEKDCDMLARSFCYAGFGLPASAGPRS